MQLYVDGELSARTAAAFCQAANELLRLRCDVVIIADDVKSVDAVGLAVLLQACRRATADGLGWSVVPSPALHEALVHSGVIDGVTVAGPDVTLGRDVVQAVPPLPHFDEDVLAAAPGMTLRLCRWQDLSLFEDWAGEPALEHMVGSTLLARCRRVGAYDADFVRLLAGDPTSLTALIVPDESSRPIGFVRLFHIDLLERFGFVETAVADGTGRSRGWGVRASRLLLSYALDVLELRRVEAKVYAYNVPSINALRRNGFVQEGRLRQAHEYDGRRWDLLVFGIVLQEMMAQRAQDGTPWLGLWPRES